MKTYSLLFKELKSVIRNLHLTVIAVVLCAGATTHLDAQKNFATVLDDGVCHASQEPGATEDIKFSACVMELSPNGGTIDGRGLHGPQHWATCPWTAVAPGITVMLGTGMHFVSVDCEIPRSVTINFSEEGSMLNPEMGA